MSAENVIPSTQSNTENRWQTLIEVDAEIRQAAAAARERGQVYEARLAEKYLTLNDKQYLSKILENVLSEADKNSLGGQTNDRGEFNGIPYRFRSDGSYVITKGKLVGTVFRSREDMENSLSRLKN